MKPSIQHTHEEPDRFSFDLRDQGGGGGSIQVRTVMTGEKPRAQLSEEAVREVIKMCRDDEREIREPHPTESYLGTKAAAAASACLDPTGQRSL